MESSAQRSRLSSFLLAIVIGRRPKLTLIRIVVLVALVFLTRQFILTPIYSMGPSMMPTYQDGGVNFVYRLAYRSHEPQRGDVVAIRFSDDKIMLMKRIIGLPGETVAFHAGRVFINDQPLDEPYVQYPTNWELPPVTVEPDKYLVVGDNRSMPPEAHLFGQAQRKRIVGKILLCKNLFASSPPSR
jgi:signal peptidase I